MDISSSQINAIHHLPICTQDDNIHINSGNAFVRKMEGIPAEHFLTHIYQSSWKGLHEFQGIEKYYKTRQFHQLIIIKCSMALAEADTSYEEGFFQGSVNCARRHTYCRKTPLWCPNYNNEYDASEKNIERRGGGKGQRGCYVHVWSQVIQQYMGLNHTIIQNMYNCILWITSLHVCLLA